MKKKGRSYLFLSKLIFTFMIIAVYCVGRSIPLYGIDMSMYEGELEAGMILEKSVCGDIYKCSVMTLGISPYMISSILVQIINACRSSDSKAKTSAKKMNRLTLVIMFLLSVIMAILRLDELKFYPQYINPLTMITAVAEMVAGAFIILWLSVRNKYYGIGGQTVFIFINILDGIIMTIRSASREEIMTPFIVSLIIAFVMLFMENCEKRIPVQRISIHSIYADKNYQAIKFNPVGVMPVMFASAAFMLPKMVIDVLCRDFPSNATLAMINEDMTLDNALGISVYICILFLLNIIFSYLLINPKDMTEQFLKSGDSLAGIHPGDDTKKYLKRHIFQICLFSSFVMGGCVLFSLILQMRGIMSSTLAMLPTSFMILMGLWSNLYNESEAVIHTDSYRTFI
ncbi:MAG: preprotein translocase subunit SecY [Lachnospiraceae bacterium]|nr:preprotein translocase subunit SecY [Lachnospiraceae bacterium]